MRNRVYAVAAAVTVALTAASVAAVGATHIPVHTQLRGMDRIATATCRVPTSLPGQRVTVMLADMGGRSPMMRGFGGMMGGNRPGGMMAGGRSMMLRAVPQTVRAGTVSLVAINHGTRTHELVVLPLAPGAPVGARPVDADDTVSESGSLGEASTSCGRGTGDGIRPGAAGWVTLSLAPGGYELVCNLPGHYAAGMFAELDVI